MTRAVMEELVVASWLATVRYPCQASREREVSRLHYGAFCSLRFCALWSPTHRLVSLNNNRHYEHITLRLRGGCLCPPFNAPCSLKEVDFAGRRHCGARHKTHREIREKSWSASWFMMMDSVCVCVAAQSNDMEERLSKVLWLCNSVADSLFRAEQQNLKRRLSNSPVFCCCFWFVASFWSIHLDFVCNYFPKSWLIVLLAYQWLVISSFWAHLCCSYLFFVVCLFVRLGWKCLTAIQSQTDRNVFSLLRIMRNSIPNGVHGSTAEQLQRYRFYLMAGQFQLCWPFRRQMQWRRPVFPFFSRNQQSKRLFLKKKDGGGCGVVVCSILTLLETAKKNWSLFRVRWAFSGASEVPLNLSIFKSLYRILLPNQLIGTNGYGFFSFFPFFIFFIFVCSIFRKAALALTQS